MKRVLLLLAVLAAVAGLGVTSGCGLTKKLTGTPHANQPPHTVLFVNGAIDTVNHVVHLYWFGTDADGAIAGFEWQMLNPHAPADTAWHLTTNTDSVFVVRDTTGYTNPVFTVRAIDNAGARDPNPPRQTFEFSNQAPTVRLTTKPLATDTTFASVSVAWSAADADGDVSKLRFLVWLDGRRDTPEITTATSFTMPSDRFLVNGVMTTGPRKLFVQAIDDGGRASPIDSVGWIVRRPVSGPNARLLLVDDVPSSNTLNSRYDTLYSNSIGRVGLATSEYTILRLDRTQPFKTAKDAEQTFKLFEAVVWYRGVPQPPSPGNVLGICEQGIGEYARAGGKIFVEGIYGFRSPNTGGSLSEDFVTTYLGSRLVRQFSTTLLDSVAAFGNLNPSTFVGNLDVGGGLIASDTIHFAGILPVANNSDGGGLREFVADDISRVAFWAGPNTLSPPNAQRVPLGLTVPQANGGRIVALGSPIIVTPGNNAGAAGFITDLLRHFGLDRPSSGRPLGLDRP